MSQAKRKPNMSKTDELRNAIKAGRVPATEDLARQALEQIIRQITDECLDACRRLLPVEMDREVDGRDRGDVIEEVLGRMKYELYRDEREQWLAIRRAKAPLIDPETAVVHCEIGWVRDPYGVYPHHPGFEDNIGAHNCFVRNVGSDIWVWDGDLPGATYKALWARIESQKTDASPDN